MSIVGNSYTVTVMSVVSSAMGLIWLQLSRMAQIVLNLFCIQNSRRCQMQLHRTLLMLALGLTMTGSALAVPSSCPPGLAKQGKCPGATVAPEIDAAAGTSAVTLLAGVVMLLKERSRRKRSAPEDRQLD
jgi:uncharacterized integral membrane protein